MRPAFPRLSAAPPAPERIPENRIVAGLPARAGRDMGRKGETGLRLRFLGRASAAGHGRRYRAGHDPRANPSGADPQRRYFLRHEHRRVSGVACVGRHSDEHRAQADARLRPLRQRPLDADGRVEAFEEKRHCAEGTISAGCYLLRRDSGVLDGLPERFSFETDVLQPLAGRGLVHGYTDNGYFIDIGVPEDYERANRELCKLF